MPMKEPTMPASLKNHLAQEIKTELDDEEVNIIEDAYRMFAFHVLQPHPSNKSGSIVFTDKYGISDIVISMEDIRSLVWFDDDDSPLYYVVIERLCLFFYGEIPAEADFVTSWRKAMIEYDNESD